jgi:hypothetical protein
VKKIAIRRIEILEDIRNQAEVEFNNANIRMRAINDMSRKGTGTCSRSTSVEIVDKDMKIRVID